MMRILALLLAAGCASPIKVPCDFNVRVHLTDDADSACRENGSRNHDGQQTPLSKRIGGCATKDWIISSPEESTLGHELRHAAERNCK